MYREQGALSRAHLQMGEAHRPRRDPPPDPGRCRTPARPISTASSSFAEIRPGRSLVGARLRQGQARVPADGDGRLRRRRRSDDMHELDRQHLRHSAARRALRRTPRTAKSPCSAPPRTEVFAIDDHCPHKGGPLTQGIVHGAAVTCPLHNWVISLETGKALGADEGEVRTIPLQDRRRHGSIIGDAIWQPDRWRPERWTWPRHARQDDLPLLRRRLRRHRRGRRGDGAVTRARRPGSSGQLRAALLQGLGARRDDRSRRAAALSGDRWAASELGRGARPRRAAIFSDTIAEHGPDSVAFYVSGQLLTEDYYVANKLMKGFIGSANIDTNSRLCMASSVAGHRRAFGSDTVPGTYEDLELADLVVLVGSNLAWCHPVLYQRLAAAKAARPDMKVVVIDPRRTADLPISPTCISRSGRTATSRCFLGLLELSGRDPARSTRRYIAGHTAVLPRRLAAADSSILTRWFERTGIQLATQFKNSSACLQRPKRTVTVLQPGRQPVGVGHRQGQRHHQLPSGHRPHRQAGHGAVLGDRPAQCHGRTRGRRPRQHACRPHGDRERRRSRPRAALLARARPSPRSPVSRPSTCSAPSADGRIKALVDHGDQPRRLDAGCRQRRGRHRAPARSSSSRMSTAETDTAELAHVLLPALGWGEKDGTVTNSERRISRQRNFHRAAAATPGPTGGSSPKWRTAWGTAKPSPMPSRRKSSPSTRRCRRSRMTARGISTSAHAPRSSPAAYDNLAPFQWPRPSSGADASADVPGRPVLYAGWQSPHRPCPGPEPRKAPHQVSSDAQHRPRARPLAHDDAHRQKRAAVAASTPSRSSKFIPMTPSGSGSKTPM